MKDLKVNSRSGQCQPGWPGFIEHFFRLTLQKIKDKKHDQKDDLLRRIQYESGYAEKVFTAWRELGQADKFDVDRDY